MYPSAILRGSPPNVGTRKTFHSVPSLRLKRMEPPSGEKDGSASGPVVSATSAPSGSCLSQMRGIPLRSDTNASVLPSGETAGCESRPEYVSVWSVGGSIGRARNRTRPRRIPIASARSAAPAAASPGTRGAAGGAASVEALPVEISVRCSERCERSRARSRVEA